MAEKTIPLLIRPGITAAGFRTAVRDYTEPTVVEELAANSYDADATTVLLLLDPDEAELHVIDDGVGFSSDAFREIATLGAGEKSGSIPFSKGKRHYLGSYGYGLKSTLNIAKKMQVESFNGSYRFSVELDWNRLDEAIKPTFKGFEASEEKRATKSTGTLVTLQLKSPQDRTHVDKFAKVLGNLPEDDGKFRCFVGMLADVLPDMPVEAKLLGRLRALCSKQEAKGHLKIAHNEKYSDLSDCEVVDFTDKEDKKVTGKIYFAGLDGEKVRKLTPGLRGIYVRIHGRLLKQSFTESRFTYPISRWKKFESGVRVEFSIDWLRDQISLSREGVRFSNEKLEELFSMTVRRNISAFIQPQLKKLKSKRARTATRKHKQRLELARKRAKREKDVTVTGMRDGFVYVPETDGELALLVAQPGLMKKVLPDHRLVDYNDQAPFDCLLYDEKRREFVFMELEPNLKAFLEHNQAKDVQLIVTWTRGRWRIGARKKAKQGVLSLIAEEGGLPGHYKLLEFASESSKKPRRDYPVLVVEEILAAKK